MSKPANYEKIFKFLYSINRGNFVEEFPLPDHIYSQYRLIVVGSDVTLFTTDKKLMKDAIKLYDEVYEGGI